MTTFATIPQYVVPKRKFQVTFTLTESGANFVRIYCTSAPPGSSLRKLLDGGTDKRPKSRVELLTTDGGPSQPWNVPADVFDVGGVYTLVAQEYARGASGFGGGYERDPDGAPSETKLGSEATLTLHIGLRVASTIAAGRDNVELVLWIWDATIRQTTLETHGEASPALLKASPSTRELCALESSAVRSALLALVGQASATAYGSPASIVSDFLVKWNTHLANGTVHDAADTDNDLSYGLASATSATNLKDTVNEILKNVRQHYTNDQVNSGVAPVGRDSANYHNVSTKQNDNANMPVVLSAGTDADAYWALADLWRSHEAHRASTAVHNSADNTSPLNALPLLLQAAKAVFEIWASPSPVVPATQSSGVVALTASGVFEEKPLGS